MATPAPARKAGQLSKKAPSSVPPAFAQSIDGKTYSTRRATLVHDNGKGEVLYRDPDAGYFLVFLSRVVGAVPMYGVRPLSDDALHAWAVNNGATGALGKASAKVLVTKLMATPTGRNQLNKLMRSR